MPASVNVDDPAHWRGRAEEARPSRTKWVMGLPSKGCDRGQPVPASGGD
jgi:hypothetical protein